jgi:hypothetical protein
MCASMEWVNLHYACKNAEDAKKLNSEIWRFRNNQGSRLPNLHAQAWATADPAKLNVVVNKTDRLALETYLLQHGYSPD